MKLLTWLGICLCWSVHGGGDLIGKFNMKSVDTDLCCNAEDNLISCESQCPPMNEIHFFIFKEEMKYTLGCPDRKSWVTLSAINKLSKSRSLRCAKSKPAEFEIRVSSKNVHQENEYVLLLADGSGACNMEPEFFQSPETKIECHSEVPKGHVEGAFKFMFLDDMGKACDYCGEDDTGKNPEQLKIMEENRKKMQENLQNEKKKEEEEKSKAEEEAKKPKVQKSANGCPPCECSDPASLAEIKKQLGGVVVFDKVDLKPSQSEKPPLQPNPTPLQTNSSPVQPNPTPVQPNPTPLQSDSNPSNADFTDPKAKKTEAWVASTNPADEYNYFKVTTYLLLFSHFGWLSAYFLFWRKPHRTYRQDFVADLLEGEY